MKQILFLMIGSFALLSCEDVVELDVPEGPPLMVVEGRVTDSAGAYVKISTTAPYFSQAETPRISNAVVTLLENGIAVGSFTESDTLAGTYYLNYVGQIGASYQVRVDVPEGFPTFGGTSWQSFPEELRRVADIDTFYSKYVEKVPGFQDGRYMFYHFKDPVGKGDRYRLRIWRNDSIQNQPENIRIFEDNFFDGKSFNNRPNQLPAAQIDRRSYDLGTRFKLEQGSITLEYFQYLQLVREQTSRGDGLFSPPPAPLFGNVYQVDNPNKQALGYFHATAVRLAEAEVSP